MPRPEPHPLALFSLKPHNPRAHDTVAHPSNSHLVSILPQDGALALDVGFNIRSKSRNTLGTLGRNDTDIIVEGSSIGRVQCSFEIDLDSRVVVLYDRSNSQTTQISGDNAIPFERGRLRRVVVQKRLNTIIGMGGVRCDRVQFELAWHHDPFDMMEMVKRQAGTPCSQEENPRLARTVDQTPTVLPSLTRIHTSGERKLRIRFQTLGPPLGSGQFGVVHKCIDVDSGKLMAVKILEQPTRTPKQEKQKWRLSLYYALKREVEALSTIFHVSRSSSASSTHETNVDASQTLLIILRHKAGTNHGCRYLWA